MESLPATTPAAAGASAVLITGGNGYLAQQLIDRLLPLTKGEGGGGGEQAPPPPPLRLGYTYTNGAAPPPLQAALPHEHASGQLWSARADLTDAASLHAAIAAFRPTVLVHAAAMSSPAGCEKDPERAMAVNFPTALLDALDAHAPDCLLVFLSTDQVFSGVQPAGALYTEDDDPTPVNAYGRTKLAFERLIRDRRPHAACVILRSSNIIGGPAPFLGQAKFLQWLDERLRTATAPLELFDDEVRSFVFVGDILDVVQGLIATTTRGGGSYSQGGGEGRTTTLAVPVQIYHMGGPEPLSRVGLAGKVCAVRGYPPHIDTTTSAEGEHDRQQQPLPRIAPVARASMDLGFTSPLNIGMDSAKLSKQSALGFHCTPMESALRTIFGI